MKKNLSILSVSLILLSGTATFTNVSAAVIYCPKPSDLICTQDNKLILSPTETTVFNINLSSPLDPYGGCKTLKEHPLTFVGAVGGDEFTATSCEYEVPKLHLYPAVQVSTNQNLKPAPPSPGNKWIFPRKDGQPGSGCGSMYGGSAVKDVKDCPIEN